MLTDPFDFDGQYGAEYEALAHNIIPGYDTFFTVVVAMLIDSVPDDGRVLVVGAGTGIEVATFLDCCPRWRITGVDPSEQMLDLARRRITARHSGRDVRLHLGYVADLPDRGPFDAATLINVMHFVPDDGSKESLLREIALRTAPGAPFVLFDLHGERDGELMQAWERYWLLRGMGAEEEAVFKERIRLGIHFASESRIHELLEKVGFAPPTLFHRGLAYGGWIAERRDEA